MKEGLNIFPWCSSLELSTHNIISNRGTLFWSTNFLLMVSVVPIPFLQRNQGVMSMAIIRTEPTLHTSFCAVFCQSCKALPVLIRKWPWWDQKMEDRRKFSGPLIWLLGHLFDLSWVQFTLCPPSYGPYLAGKWERSLLGLLPSCSSPVHTENNPEKWSCYGSFMWAIPPFSSPTWCQSCFPAVATAWAQALPLGSHPIGWSTSCDHYKLSEKG